MKPLLFIFSVFLLLTSCAPNKSQIADAEQDDLEWLQSHLGEIHTVTTGPIRYTVVDIPLYVEQGRVQTTKRPPNDGLQQSVPLTEILPGEWVTLFVSVEGRSLPAIAHYDQDFTKPIQYTIKTVCFGDDSQPMLVQTSKIEHVIIPYNRHPASFKSADPE